MGWMALWTNSVQPVYLVLLTACHGVLLLCSPWRLGQRPQRGYSRLVMKIFPLSLKLSRDIQLVL